MQVKNSKANTLTKKKRNSKASEIVTHLRKYYSKNLMYCLSNSYGDIKQ